MPRERVGRTTSVRGLLLALAVLTMGPGRLARAQSPEPPFRLTVEEGTPLRVAVERRLIVKRVGQPIEAVLVDPVFVYDRVVIPVGARVIGHVDRREAVSKKRRSMAMLSGDFTPLHNIGMRFDELVLADGRRLPVRTEVSPGIERVRLAVAEGTEKQNVIVRAGEEVLEPARQTISMLGPGRWERMKDAGLRALPYHPEFYSKGTVFTARLQSALDLGAMAAPAERAEAGAAPAPGTLLSARMVAPIDSGHASRGTPVEAVVTRPVFSPTHQVIVPAGGRLTGHVTFVKRARSFRRNGQVRFLFDSIHVTGSDPAVFLASLQAVEAGGAARVSVDDEGGTKVTNSPARFIAPALGSLALVGLAQGHLDYDTDGAGPEMAYGGPVSGSVAGLVGASVTGLAISSLGHPAAVALGVLGVARTTYSAVFAKGREVVFSADTPIQVQLAPGPHASKK